MPAPTMATDCRRAAPAAVAAWLPAVTGTQYFWGGCCVGSRPNRFLHVVRSRLNLSSGEKRAGCADAVGVPSGPAFCSTSNHGQKVAWR